MRKVLLFLILVAAGFAAGYGAARWKTYDLISSKWSGQSGKPTAQFKATQYPLENFPFCLVIIGRNNGASLEKTLQSAFSQVYENFRILYVDDASDDGSLELARDLILASPRFAQIQVIHNEKPLGVLGSLSQIVRNCSDEEIVVVLNGEDWLAHEWVLMRLNQYYADPDLWLAYGPSCDYPTYQVGNPRPVHESDKPIRTLPLGAAHLKSFYAGLFKKIHDADFRFKGEYFSAAADLAYMIPMLEMAKTHSQCLQEALYVCNKESGKGEEREQQAFFEKHIRSLQPYPELASFDAKGSN